MITINNNQFYKHTSVPFGSNFYTVGTYYNEYLYLHLNIGKQHLSITISYIGTLYFRIAAISNFTFYYINNFS